MTFNATLAIARMESAGHWDHSSGSSLEDLERMYPDLKFVFDELRDLREDKAEADTATLYAHHRLDDLFAEALEEGAEHNVQSLLTIIQKIEEEVTNL